MTRLPPVRRFDSNTGARIYRIACDVLPDFSGRVHLILGAGPPTLVDAGSGREECTAQILAGLETVAGEFHEPEATRIERVLVTHAHYDHIGGLAAIVRRFDAAVGVHPLDRAFVAAWDERAILHNLAALAFLARAGLAPQDREELMRVFGVLPGRVQSVPVAFALREQEPLDGIRIVHIPGHSPGHVAIVVGNVLLCGDHVLARTVPQQWPESVTPYTGMGHYLESLGRLQRLEGIEWALGGHEPPIEDLAQRIVEIRASHHRRLDRLTDILRKAEHPLTIGEATERMYSRQQGFRRFLALADVGARIEYLDLRGRLRTVNIRAVEQGDEVALRFRPTEGP
jgi:glyoxylase-like metal-dependent hydrolase (beta-lactamase superfamily II)